MKFEAMPYTSMFAEMLLLALLLNPSVTDGDGFTFNGFTHANLSLTGIANVTPDGLLMLTNATQQTKGQAFYPLPFQFKPVTSLNTDVFSFSTTFVFAIVSDYRDTSSFGLTLAISPTQHPPGEISSYLGLFNDTNNGKVSNHIVAVEMDTIQNPEFNDIDDNHLGIDVNGLISIDAHTAGYYARDGVFKNLSLISGDAMQVWVDYDASNMHLNVTLAPVNITKPKIPLLSSAIDLSKVILDPMYIGFTASEGNVLTRHYVLGWSFNRNGEAPPLNLSSLPQIPQISVRDKSSQVLLLLLPISVSIIIFLTALITGYIYIWKNKFTELVEDWEKEYGPHRFKYKDLYVATDGFKDKRLLGTGGFGSVYRGILPKPKIEVAVKRLSHESRQGIKEFVAEVVSIGQLRHRNLVKLLGYCRRKGELLLVYEYMPNGSLDKYLHSKDVNPGLNWAQRFQIIKGIASCLVYLHEDWEKVVIHRDIKASNILLDSEFNARLGDFGLARLYDHGKDPHTTHVVGTMGYLAPELARRGKATTGTDVFSFGVFLLEVACGRRPGEPLAVEDEPCLIDWVLAKWQNDAILEASDNRLDGNFDADEMNLVLNLGLLCCHPLDSARPSMRQVVQFLDRDVVLPAISPAYMNSDILTWLKEEGIENYMIAYPSSTNCTSILSGDHKLDVTKIDQLS